MSLFKRKRVKSEQFKPPEVVLKAIRDIIRDEDFHIVQPEIVLDQIRDVALRAIKDYKETKERMYKHSNYIQSLKRYLLRYDN